MMQKHPYSSFLNDLDIRYGPRDVLGRFFLVADRAARDLGVTLSFGSFGELVATNASNRSSWLPLLPTYHPDYSTLTEDDFCLIGRDSAGQVVATHATRVFNIPDSSFKKHAESMKIFYADPTRMIQPGERCVVTAPSADRIAGKIYFGGAAWYHPRFRGCGLGHIIPRVSRAVALAHSSIDWIVGIMAEKVVRGGLADRSGYRNVEWEMRLDSAFVGHARCAIAWMSREELIDDLTCVQDSIAAKVDARVA